MNVKKVFFNYKNLKLSIFLCAVNSRRWPWHTVPSICIAIYHHTPWFNGFFHTIMYFTIPKLLHKCTERVQKKPTSISITFIVFWSTKLCSLSVHLWSSFGMVKYVIVRKKPLNQGVCWYMEMHIVGTVCHGYLREFTAQRKIDNLIFYN